jgi:hypothetical protein
VLDLHQRRLPNWLVLPAYPAIIGLVAVDAATSRAPSILIRSITGMAIFMLFMSALQWIFNGRQGLDGDVKLSAWTEQSSDRRHGPPSPPGC